MGWYVSKEELTELGTAVIKDYEGGVTARVPYVNIDKFIAEYLGLKLIYLPFAEEDRSKMGFLADGYTPLKVWQDGRPVSRVFDRDTVVLDSYLLNKGQEGPRAFTAAHEAGHYILEKHGVQRARFHREFDSERMYDGSELSEMFSVEESQADRLAAVLLMPEYKVRAVLKEINGGIKPKTYGDTVTPQETKHIIGRMAKAMRVSYSAMYIRFRELDLFDRRPLEEYLGFLHPAPDGNIAEDGHCGLPF